MELRHKQEALNDRYDPARLRGCRTLEVSKQMAQTEIETQIEIDGKRLSGGGNHGLGSIG